MMNRLENAARQALEALEYVLKPTADFDEAVCQKLHDTAITALREALAEQQAAESNAVLVEGFGRVAMRKLNDLREKGYAINGVSIATISEAGETNRGAVTTGGMVLWWPQQPAEQAAEPVAWQAEHQSGEWVTRKTPTLPSTGIFTGRIRALYTHPAPTQQPLTDDAKDAKDAERYRWLKSRMMGADFDWNESGACALVFEWPRDVPIGADCDRNIDNAIEAAHGITSKEGGAA